VTRGTVYVRSAFRSRVTRELIHSGASGTAGR